MSRLVDAGLISAEEHKEMIDLFNAEVKKMVKGMPKKNKSAILDFAQDVRIDAEYTGRIFSMVERLHNVVDMIVAFS